MERPWLILRRVLDVHTPGDDDDDLHADAEEQENAQAQEEQHSGVVVGDAEEHVAAVDAAVEAAQAQHDAVAEADALEESILDANLNMMVSKGAHKMMRARGFPRGPAPDITITVAPPLRISALITGPGAHPDSERPDMYPYIIATGRFCLLVHFAVAPSYGTNFDQKPNHSHLAVVRYFLRDDGGAQIAACADRVPDRPDDDLVNIPALSKIDSVGLACNQQTGDIQIAELIVTTGAPQVAVVYIGSTDTDGWQANHYVNPLMREDPLRNWVPNGTVTINSSTFLWYDLSWGIISCDLAQPRLLQTLDFHRLPPGRALRAGAGDLPDLHCRRCIAVSENLVRYVEIILEPPNQAATTVNMWYRDLKANNPWRWQMNYSESFMDIWDDESYQQAGLPRNIPMLVGVSPVNSSVVYFSLDQRLFGVNVPEHTVVHCQEYEPLNRPGLDDEPVTSRYLITWNLDADQANVGHHPNEPSDHGDSSPCGPMDEGEIDFETPPK